MSTYRMLYGQIVAPSRVSRSVLLLILLVNALGACGGEDKAAPAPSEDKPSPAASEGIEKTAQDCGSVKVPGHEAVQIKASGTSCGSAKKVAAAAEGRGRASYEQSGFSCKPSDAGGGDTNYVCDGAGGRIAFRYGTV